MEEIKNFLESSSINGLTHISVTKKHVRLFWILVVILGFTGASIIIYQSFQSWEMSPVKTTIETQPIREITFPKVTVCPPKNTYTDLNYDLMMTENMSLNNDTRNMLANYALGKSLKKSGNFHTNPFHLFYPTGSLAFTLSISWLVTIL